MSDGPFCLPLEKYHDHSKLFYADTGHDANSASFVERRSPHDFGKLWLDSKQKADQSIINFVTLSNDKGRDGVGIQVLQH